MSDMFLNPRRPLTTCTAKSCEGCPVSKDVHCHFHGLDLAGFLFAGLPMAIIGGAGIVQIGAWWLAPWLLISFSYFGFVEIRVMCSHCPHYAEPGKSLQCWANYGSPRLWKYRPGPMTAAEKTVFITGLALVMGYPLAFLLIGPQWFLLAVYLLTVVGFYLTLRRSYCSECMNFACPLNLTDEKVRTEFIKRNPTIAKAWGRTGD
jgi:hypothetical protein